MLRGRADPPVRGSHREFTALGELIHYCFI